MIPDWETNLVLVSDLLPARHPEIVQTLKDFLAEHTIPLQTIQGTADIWIRDYAPVQTGPSEFVQFRYRPDYLKGHRRQVTKPAVFRDLDLINGLKNSALVIDGGNIVGGRSTALLTDKVFRENPRQLQSALAEKLQRLLKTASVIFIPKEPYDRIGHADGMLRLVEDNHVVLSDYRSIDPVFADRIEGILTENKLRVTPIPYVPERRIRDGINSAVGNYANFLRVGNLTVVPAYGLPEDRLAAKILARLLPKDRIISVPCRKLAEEGGALNCVTSTIFRPQEGLPNRFCRCDKSLWKPPT